MTKDQRIVYQLRWMNKSRFKDAKGNLIIKKGPEFESREKADQEFEKYDPYGYALQLVQIEQSLLECINFSNLKDHPKKWVSLKEPLSIRENPRWYVRALERDREILKKKIAATEKILEDLKDELKVYEMED